MCLAQDRLAAMLKQFSMAECHFIGPATHAGGRFTWWLAPDKCETNVGHLPRA